MIDNPLPPHAGQEHKRQLHHTIRNLNRGQKNRLIHFEGDGTGEKVKWIRLCAASDEPLRDVASPARIGPRLVTP